MNLFGAIVGAGNIVRDWTQRGQKARNNVKTAMGRLALRLTRKVKQDKLSGQVLKNRTGRLRRSINQRVSESSGEIKAVVGTNVEYGRTHELGFSGQMSVKEHMRKIRMAWGKAIKPKSVMVRAHTRNVKIPERSFLRSALAEFGPEINRDLERAFMEGWK